MTDKITFENATASHEKSIFSWLLEPHVNAYDFPRDGCQLSNLPKSLSSDY
jgi:hypothetical protein